MTDNNSITRDPIYYFTAGFFALLTTALPSLLGQPRFLPTIQTLALTIFVAVALHRHNLRGALRVMILWLPIQFIVITLLSLVFRQQVESAFTDGFLYRGAVTSWFFAGAPYPAGLASEPISYVIEVVGILLGSLATAGLIGTWFLVRLVNQAAFSTGILLTSIEDSSLSLLVLPYWTLLRAAGYAGLIVLCAEPVLTNHWSSGYYWQKRGKVLLISITLVLLGLLLELFLPGIVARTPLS